MYIKTWLKMTTVPFTLLDEESNKCSSGNM